MSDAVAEIADLRALLAARDTELATARAELTGARLLIAQYQAQLAKLRRMQFGRSSETLGAEIRQLELLLEDLEEGEAAHTMPARLPGPVRSERRHPQRRPLPDHLPRETIVHPAGDRCPGCGGLHFAALGEDVTEILEKVPARLRVIRHVRPKLSCRSCSTILQAPAPDLPVAKGRPGPGLLANVVVSKYLDGLPLYRHGARPTWTVSAMRLRINSSSVLRRTRGMAIEASSRIGTSPCPRAPRASGRNGTTPAADAASAQTTLRRHPRRGSRSPSR